MVKESVDLLKWGSYSTNKRTAIALGFLAYQTNILSQQTQILKTQFEEKDRPWIAIDGITEYAPNKIQFDYTNYGAVPNTQGQVMAGFSRNPITRDSAEVEPFKNTEIILPNQHQHLPLGNMDPHYLQEAKSGSSLYVVFVIKYDFHNNEHGEYGYISKYSTDGNSFETVDSWAK